MVGPGEEPPPPPVARCARFCKPMPRLFKLEIAIESTTPAAYSEASDDMAGKECGKPSTAACEWPPDREADPLDDSGGRWSRVVRVVHRGNRGGQSMADITGVLLAANNTTSPGGAPLSLHRRWTSRAGTPPPHRLRPLPLAAHRVARRARLAARLSRRLARMPLARHLRMSWASRLSRALPMHRRLLSLVERPGRTQAQRCAAAH